MTLTEVTSNGELLLISVALAAAAIGDLLGKRNGTLTMPKLISSGICMLMLLIASFYYADISACRMSGQPIQDGVIASVSLISCACTLVCGGCCVALSEVD